MTSISPVQISPEQDKGLAWALVLVSGRKPLNPWNFLGDGMFITHGGILGPHAKGTTQDGVTLVVRLLCIRGLGLRPTSRQTSWEGRGVWSAVHWFVPVLTTADTEVQVSFLSVLCAAALAGDTA